MRRKVQNMALAAEGGTKNGKVIMDELIKEVLEGWGDYSVRFDGKPAPGPVRLELERAIVFSGATQGTLVLRCPSGLGRVLAKAHSHDAMPGEAEEVFRDLCVQVGRRLLESLGGPDERPVLLSDRGPSTSQDWPAGRPRLALALLVDGLPLEVRLWLKGQTVANLDLHLDSSSRRAAQRVRNRNQKLAWVYA